MTSSTSASPTLDGIERHNGTSPLERIQHILHSYSAVSPAAVLVVSGIAFTLLGHGRFARPQNLSLVLQQVAVIGALAIGQTLVILTAGIDLSVGAVMLLAQMLAAKLGADHGVPAILTLAVALVVGTVVGAINGGIITRLKLPPFIVTLGTLGIFTSLGLSYAGGITIPEAKLSSLLLWTKSTIKIGSWTITTGVMLMVVMYIVMGFILKNTAWGRHVYAVGDDIEAARLAGIRVDRVIVSVYALAGLIFGITAWIQIGRAQSANTNAIVDANLNSITAVVIGGTSLFGGRGLLVGSLLGALIVGVFRNGLELADVNAYWQPLAVGVLIIAAAGIDQWIRKVGK
jgi:fructose transport system permease protein